jgi:hypothetical protein
LKSWKTPEAYHGSSFMKMEDMLECEIVVNVSR